MTKNLKLEAFKKVLFPGRQYFFRGGVFVADTSKCLRFLYNEARLRRKENCLRMEIQTDDIINPVKKKLAVVLRKRNAMTNVSSVQ